MLWVAEGFCSTAMLVRIACTISNAAGTKLLVGVPSRLKGMLIKCQLLNAFVALRMSSPQTAPVTKVLLMLVV